MEKYCTENQNILCSITLFFFENHAVNEIVWKNIVEKIKTFYVPLTIFFFSKTMLFMR